MFIEDVVNYVSQQAKKVQGFIKPKESKPTFSSKPVLISNVVVDSHVNEYTKLMLLKCVSYMVDKYVLMEKHS